MKCQPHCQKCDQNVFLRSNHIALDKSDISLVVLPQVVQKQTLGKLGN